VPKVTLSWVKCPAMTPRPMGHPEVHILVQSPPGPTPQSSEAVMLLIELDELVQPPGQRDAAAAGIEVVLIVRWSVNPKAEP